MDFKCATSTLPPVTDEPHWLVLKGYALRDGFPGKDCRMLRLPATTQQLAEVLSQTLAAESDDVDIVHRTGAATARAVGKRYKYAAVPVGARAYIARAQSEQAFYNSRDHDVRQAPVFTAFWLPTHPNPGERRRERISRALAEQLRMLLEERGHL
jgi:hypothetical protein